MRAKIWQIGTALLVAAVAAAGCGDDAGTSAAPTAAPSSTAAHADSGDAFCDALVDFNRTVFRFDLDESSSTDDVKAAGATLGPLWAAVEDHAPEALRATVGDLGDSIHALQDGDQTAFSADQTLAAYAGVVAGAVDGCGIPTTDVTGVDYAFQGIPATIAAGTTAFRFTNGGSEDHELLVFPRPEGDDRPAAEVLANPARIGSEPQPVLFAFASPGQSMTAMADLEPGAYIAACFLPMGGAEDGAPHAMNGMVADFTVS
jgi:hypothetical protein